MTPVLPLPGVRFVQVQGDHMEPTLTSRDLVAVVPVAGFRVDGLYLIADTFGTEIVKRAQWIPGSLGASGHVRLYGDRPGAGADCLSQETFARCVRGIVAAEVRVTRADLLRGG